MTLLFHRTPLRRSAGIFTLLLSIVGLLLCLAVATGVWVVKRQVSALNTAVFETADEAFAFVDNRLDRVTLRVATSRERVRGVSVIAERVKSAGVDVRVELQPAVRTLDDVFEQLKSAEQGLDSIEATTRSVNRLSDAVAAKREATSDAESAGVTARRVAALTADVADTLARLDAMRRELIDARESGELRRETAAGIISRVSNLDGRLANLSARIGTFQTEVSAARASTADVGRRIQFWITFGALALVLVAFWFAISQVGMMRTGWRLARTTATAPKPE